MKLSHIARHARGGAAAAACLLTLLVFAACNSDDDATGPDTTTVRTYNQVQRLGNPLVSEVFLAKKDHPYHGTLGPDGDVAAFATPVKGFVAAFRPQATELQTTLASVLLPDMLIVQTDKDPATAGWLSWALSNGWGGRKLTDDVVDVGLSAIFSDLLSPVQSVCKPFVLPLCTDNIATHSQFTTSFPYLATAK